MKHTEEEIEKLARKILKDIDFEYHEKKELWLKYTEDRGRFHTESKIKKGWSVGVDWFDPDYLGGMDKTGFINIDDETGEPERFSLRSGGQGQLILAKDEYGKYYVLP
jgi:hypothetical protein